MHNTMSDQKLDLSMSLKEANETKNTLADVIICYLAQQELSEEQRSLAHRVWITSSTLIEQNTIRKPKG